MENSWLALSPALSPRRAHIHCKGSANSLGFERLKLYSDVLRRRFQINKMKSMGYKYKSIWDAVKIIAAEEGLRGFYKGIIPNLLKVAPSMASSFLSFEMTRDFFVSLGDDEV